MSYTYYMTTLSIRIEEKTKKEASKTLESLGLDMSSAVKMFLHQVIVEQAIPFKASRKPIDIRKAWDTSFRDASKQKGYKNAKELFKAINSAK